MEKNKADVTICGTEYMLSSDKTIEEIKEIAKYVDDELRKTSKMLNCNPNYKCAVLTALNIAEKLKENSDLLLKFQTENHQLDNDVNHYVSLWENAKKQVTDLKDKMDTEVDRSIQDNEKYKQMEQKLEEMKNSYFDLQTENVNLKNEIRNIKKLTISDNE